MGNSFGTLLKLHSFGESHGRSLGGILEGFPAGILLDFSQIQFELDRRRTNQGIYSSSRKESDQLQILSGIMDSKTLGTPIGFMVENGDAKSEEYQSLKDIYRPSHADFTWQQKYGFRDFRGGGRSSARETLARVVGGAMAKQFLQLHGISLQAWVSQIGNITANITTSPSQMEVEQSKLRCPDKKAEGQMFALIEQLAQQKDSVGGVVQCQIEGVPAGLGEPVFDKLQAVLAHAMLSINAVKGFEYGSGFAGSAMKGSEHNDEFVLMNQQIKTTTNWSGGIQGGISNGQAIYFKVAFKPIASIGIQQKAINMQGAEVDLEIGGRHDVCVVPRAVPIVEAMAALVIMDFFLMQKINQA
jgi:chorismate synthase